MQVTKEQIALIENHLFNYLKAEHGKLAALFYTLRYNDQEAKDNATKALKEVYKKCNDLEGIDAFLRLVYTQERLGHKEAVENIMKAGTKTKKDFNDTLRMVDRLNEIKEISEGEDLKLIEQILKLF